MSIEFKNIERISKLSYGKHKVPRYLYHLTSKEAYQSILKDGRIKQSKESFFGKGVFTVELSNLFKFWGKNPKYWGEDTLAEKLIKRALHGKDEIVILKIPTSALDADKLLIRSQNKSLQILKICKENFKNQVRQMIFELQKMGVSFNKSVISTFEHFVPEKIEHLENGVSARYSTLYNQRKEALEYIYREDISIKNAEKIGELNLTKFQKTAEYDFAHPIKSIFSKLLEGQKESKGVE